MNKIYLIFAVALPLISSVGIYAEGSGIPQWVKNNACWWSQGQISDADFAAGIEYLVRAGIIVT